MWQLKSLPKEVEDISMDEEDNEKDFLDFLEDLEEDKAFREGVNIYRNPKPLAAALDESDHEEYPQIGVEEMLQNLTLSNY
jgi:nonsense-mediated mRNA decay protein 3